MIEKKRARDARSERRRGGGERENGGGAPATVFSLQWPAVVSSVGFNDLFIYL